MSIDPKNETVGTVHGHLLSAISPRPIAFASTVDAQGRPNLSPFSFFNVFGANPPIVIFSPTARHPWNPSSIPPPHGLFLPTAQHSAVEHG